MINDLENIFFSFWNIIGTAFFFLVAIALALFITTCLIEMVSDSKKW